MNWKKHFAAIAFILALGTLAPPARAADCNTNGVDDAVDISGGQSVDWIDTNGMTTSNGIPDECDVITWIEKRLAESDDKQDMRTTSEGWFDSFGGTGGFGECTGQSYNAALQYAIDNALDGATIELDALPDCPTSGIFPISTPLHISWNDDVTLTAGRLGKIILYGDGLENSTVVPSPSKQAMFYVHNVTTLGLENIVLWSDCTTNAIEAGDYSGCDNTVGILLHSNNTAVHVKNNVVRNFATGIFVGHNSYATIPYEHVVEENYVLECGYSPLTVKGANNSVRVSDVTIQNNFVSASYQGITTEYVTECEFLGNIVRGAHVGGVRIEDSPGNTFRGNLIHANGFQGFWLYSVSGGATVESNIIIDNNRHARDYQADCWTPQWTVWDAYYSHPANYYPWDWQENGYDVFQFGNCQFNGVEVELRNNIDDAEFSYNVIGRYEGNPTPNDTTGSHHDIQVSYFPIMYSSDPLKLSDDNSFDHNFFLASKAERLLDRGCGTQASTNGFILFSPLRFESATAFDHQQALCDLPTCDGTPYYDCCTNGQCYPCNTNGICESERGEKTGYCTPDCPVILAGQSGSRAEGDFCAWGLTYLEPQYPNPSCGHAYDGHFWCEEIDAEDLGCTSGEYSTGGGDIDLSCLSPDCNDNDSPDICDIAVGTSQNCQAYLYTWKREVFPDECEITMGWRDDLNTNGVPDECDPDCNNNEIPDDLDISAGTSEDCNTNAVPDECDLSGATSEDCNTNGIPDECDINSATSGDCDLDGVPDECEMACATTSACPDADVNCDNNVNSLDVVLVQSSANYGRQVCHTGGSSPPATQAYNPRADVNRDGTVSGLDVAAIQGSPCYP